MTLVSDSTWTCEGRLAEQCGSADRAKVLTESKFDFQCVRRRDVEGNVLRINCKLNSKLHSYRVLERITDNDADELVSICSVITTNRILK